jgi:hypothetical protein
MNSKKELLCRHLLACRIRAAGFFLMLGQSSLHLLLLLILLALPEDLSHQSIPLRLLMVLSTWWPVMLVPLIIFLVGANRVAALDRKLCDLSNSDSQKDNAA